MQWVRDIQAETVMKRLAMPWNVVEVDQGAIDVKASRKNWARLEAIDREHAAAISDSINRGDAIPMIVLRAKSYGQHVIAGGNHRDQACRMAGVTSRRAYVVTCDDVAFLELCRLLNSVVGKGSTAEDRLRHACDAVEAKAMTQADAMKEYCVKQRSLKAELMSRRADRRLRAVMSGRKVSLPKCIKEAMASVHADKVLEEAVDFAVSRGRIHATDVAHAIRQAVELLSEGDQIAFLAAERKRLQAEFATPIRSEKRRQFLRCLSELEKLLSKADNVTDLDMDAATAREVRERCKLIANTLCSL